MTFGTILLFVLILILMGAIPAWQYSASWGFGPMIVVAVILVIMVALIIYYYVGAY